MGPSRPSRNAQPVMQPIPGRPRLGAMQRTLGALLIAVSLVSGCGGPATLALAKADLPRASADPADANLAAGAINAFGLELFRQSGSGAGTGLHNSVVSPASIVIALAMARAGAVGRTAAEMDAVLHDIATADHTGWLNALDAVLTTRTGSFPDFNGKSRPVTLRIANAPFVQQDMTVVPTYLNALATQFGAGLRLVDYKTNAEAARKAINGWVDGQTESRIPELIAPGVLDENTRLALVNAIYLKAPWLTPFSPDNTATGPFTRPDGSTVDASLMQAQIGARYASGAGWQAVELPYVGGSLALTIILPDDIAAFEASLTPAILDGITGGLANREVNLTLPKFGIDSKLELRDVLTAMGMPTAFDPDRADFSGITTEAQLYISAVIHQANIDVDEKGTTAAAATAVVIGRTSMPADVVTLRVDRPFLFALRDVPTGTVLFLGRVADPSK
jgi:serine protease inhibitor